GNTVGTGNELDNVILSGFTSGSLFGMGGNDELVARGTSSFELHGGDGNDTLNNFGTGDSQMFGDAGNDVLNSALADTLTGGTGADSFVMANATSGRTITDFASAVDKIHLDAHSMTALGTSGNFAAGDVRFFAAAGAT